MKKLPKKDRKRFVPLKGEVAEDNDFILWKDSKVVVFYCNCLKSMPTEVMMDDTNDFAKECLHGMSTIQRWTSDENMYRRNISVLSIIIAYNNYMNSVNDMDHIWSSNPTRH